eukprot:10891848-Lingulodinium_polyedra.AAC.1
MAPLAALTAVMASERMLTHGHSPAQASKTAHVTAKSSLNSAARPAGGWLKASGAWAPEPDRDPAKRHWPRARATTEMAQPLPPASRCEPSVKMAMAS